jgi:Domain of unknown function (DUF5666)
VRLGAFCRVLAVALAIGCSLQVQAQNVCAAGASPPNPRPVPQPVVPGAGGVGGTGVVAGRPGLGGTGIDPGGIGGTGQVAGRPGIGGTGIDPGGIGGTGIVGVITGFASICVNGLEVHFDDTTPVSDAGEPVPARQLALGQLVAVQARGQGAELSASRIALIHTVVGPIGALDAVAGQMVVLGQTVVVQDRHDLDDLQPGDWVRVSGLRQARGVIAATRIDAIAAQPQAQLTGIVEGVQGDQATVGQARVRIAAGQGASGLVPGREITVAGRWDGLTLFAQRVLQEPTRQGIAGASRVVLEGFVHSAGGGQLDLGLGPLSLAPGARLPGGGAAGLAVNQRVLVTGSVGPDQHISVDSVVLRESAGEGARGSAVDNRRGPRGRGGRDAAEAERERSRDRERIRERFRERDNDRGRDRDLRVRDDSGRGDRSGSDDSGKSSGGSDDSGGSNSGSGSRDK